jgi:acyl carrier protein
MFTTATKSIATADGTDAVSLDVQPQPVAVPPASHEFARVRDKVRAYILNEILLGTTAELDDSASLLNAGILDSTGTMELIAFLEGQFGLTIFDSDIIADNLDSVDRICAFVGRSQGAAGPAT